MARRTNPPAYTKHSTGQARVRIDGKVHYLGEYSSPESKARYAELVADWLTEQGTDYRNCPRLTVAKVAVAYVRHCQTYYVKDGRQTSEVQAIRDALKHLLAVCGKEETGKFSPKRLKAVRDRLVRKGLARTTVNAAIRRIRRMFRWAVEEELVRPAVLQGLEAVADLRKGRSEARESTPVKPVSEADINAVLPLVSRQVRDMIRLQLLCGCRPNEIVTLQPCNVNRDGDVWEAVLADHKCVHHEVERRLYFGPRAQAILAPYLDNRPAESPCFSPAEAEEDRRAEQRRKRRTPVQPSQRNRKRGGSKVGDAYDVASYRRTIARACDEAGIERWSPNRLRHSRATDLRKRYGIEAASSVCGHTKIDTTLLYAEESFDQARKVMAEVG